jgi:Ca2+-binding RTX toxin-like protein
VAADSTLNLIDLGGEFFPDSGAINSIVANGSADDTSMLANADGNRRQRLEYHDATSVVAAGDVEMGRFDLRKGDVVAVDVNGYVPGSIDNLSSVVRVFNSAGTQIAFDSGSGVDEDSELVFAARTTGAYYIAVSGQGNASYNGLDGTGTLTGDSGFFTAVLHLNPTSIGSSAAQTLNGTAGDDYIVLMAGDDTSAGGDGADTVSGGDENDTISGVAGNDYLYGDSGDDALNGGNGDDILIGGYGIDALAGSNDNDLLDGGDGNDSLNGGNNDDVLFGGAGLDVLNGGNGDDTLDGGNDNDSLSGDANNDTIEGGAGNDTLRGGTGNDRQTGGSGNDVHLGGAGADTFVFTGSTQGNDRIDDWVAVDDQLEIDASAFGGGLVAGGLAANQLVVGSAPVATQAFGQFLYNTTNGQLSWDDDGTGAGAAIAITRLLNGGLAVGTLAVGDFDIVA